MSAIVIFKTPSTSEISNPEFFFSHGFEFSYSNVDKPLISPTKEPNIPSEDHSDIFSSTKALVIYDEILERDKTSLDIFWLKDESLSDLDNLPDPDILANEIIENIEAGLDSFKAIMATLSGE